MKKAIGLLLAFLLLATSVSAAEPSGWDEGLFWWEAGAGLLLGVGAYVGTNCVCRPYSAENRLVIDGVYFLATAGGVLLVGELFGEESDNFYLTYPLTFAVSAGYPILSSLAFSSLLHSEDPETGLVKAGWAIITAVTNSLATAAVYNWVKIPEKPEETLDTGFNIKPYATYLADSGGDLIPVYGVSVSF
ncbi:MAG: hypothetical protein GY771_02695 [bacterium]|nr:hypothetical protein [bacterium]